MITNQVLDTEVSGTLVVYVSKKGNRASKTSAKILDREVRRSWAFCFYFGWQTGLEPVTPTPLEMK